MTDSTADVARDDFGKHLDQLMHEMADEDGWTRFNALMQEAATAEFPHPITRYAPHPMIDLMVDSFVASRLYQIWAELGDRFEVKPDEWFEAEADMKTAAREWLALPDDPAAVNAYLDHWYYDVCGYARDLQSPG